MNSPYPKISKRRRHIFSNGTVIFFRPSLITTVFLASDFPASEYAFNYYFDGNNFRAEFASKAQAEYERKRLVAFAGGEVVPPEVRM